MIPIGTSDNPGELWSCPKWEKTVISCLGALDMSPSSLIAYISKQLLEKYLHIYSTTEVFA